LPIGGLKEKLLAAQRGGITTVLIPMENEKDLSEIPENVKGSLKIVPVAMVDEALSVALSREPVPIVISGLPDIGSESPQPTADSAEKSGDIVAH
jgi:ATP-dependent Lon protease